MAVVRTVLMPVLGCLLLAACSGEPAPEERIRDEMRRAEEAVESGDPGDLMELVSERYRDAAGRDRQALRGLVSFYLLQNEKLHVFYQEKELILESPDRGEVVAVVALAGRPLDSGLDLSRISADLLRVRATFEREDDRFRVVEADWEGAALADFVID